MKKLMLLIGVLGCLPLGCAFYSEKNKMEQYGRTLDTYETAMRVSDFNSICQFVDPAAMTRQDCLKRFGDIRIVDYKVLQVHVAEDRSTVDQEVEVSYFFLNNVILKKTGYQQTWTYQEKLNKWLLKGGPPPFK